VSQTIGIVVNGDEADTTKLRGTSHSTPKEPKDYTKNVDSVNRDGDRSKYQQTNADENSNVETQSQQDKNTVISLKTDTQVDKGVANQVALPMPAWMV
jgi:hypothetical protein